MFEKSVLRLSDPKAESKPSEHTVLLFLAKRAEQEYLARLFFGYHGIGVYQDKSMGIGEVV